MHTNKNLPSATCKRPSLLKAAFAFLACLGLMPAIAQAQERTLQISVQNAQYAAPGSISPSAGAVHTYADGAIVTLSAEALQGYTYHWECLDAPSIHNQTGTVSLAMTQSYAVRLVFSPNYYSLNLVTPVTGGTAAVLAPVPADMSHIAVGTIVSVQAGEEPGYSFVEWITDPAESDDNKVLSPTSSSSKVSVYMSKDLKLTPVFAKAKYMLNTLDSPADIGGRTTGGGYYNQGETASISATANAGFVFDGWEVTAGTVTIANAASPSTTASLGAVSGSEWKITAKFRVADPEQTTLIVESEAGGKVDATPTPPPNVGTTTVLGGSSAMLTVTADETVDLVATVGDGHTFAGWDGPVVDPLITSTRVLVKAATTVKARFTPLSYNFTVNAEAAPGYAELGTSKLEAAGTGASGPLLASTAGTSVRPLRGGTPVVLTATPAAGYAFAGWKHAANAFSAADTAVLAAQGPTTGTATATITMPAKAVAITALFLKIPNTYTLNLNAFPGGGATASGTFTHPVSGITATTSIIADGSGSYQENAVVNLVATPSPATHFKFSQWSGGGVVNPSSAITTVLMNASKTVTATFERTHADLAVSVSPLGAGSIVDNVTSAAPAVTHMVGSTVNLRPVAANANWRFKEWKVDGVASGDSVPLPVLMNDNRTVEAVFAAQHTLTVSVDDPAAGNASGAGLYVTGETASINVSLNEGWIFKHWSGDVIGISPNATTKSASLVMTSDRTVTAETVRGKQVTITAIGTSGVFNPDSTDGPAIKATGAFYVGNTERTSICHSAGGVDTAHVAPNAIITLSAPLTASADYPKWRFLHWEDIDSPGTSVGPGYTVTKDVILRAVYTDQRTLTADVTVDSVQNPSGAPEISAGGVSMSGGSTRNFSYSTSQTVVSAPAAPGLVFMGWGGAVDAAPNLATNSVTMNNDKSITAAYRSAFTLTVGAISIPAGAPLNLGELVTVTGARGGSSPLYTFASGDTASLRIEQPLITVGGHTYRFKGWDASGRDDGTVDNTSATFNVPMNANKTVKAVYVRQVAVTFQVGGGTGSTTPSGVQNYDYGDTLNFSATPATGSIFDRWESASPLIFNSGATSPANSVSNITTDATLTAYFKLTQNALTARILVDGVVPTDSAVINVLTITADGTALKNGESKEYLYNASASVQAATASGFRFKGWICTAEGFTPVGDSAALFVLGPQTVTASYESIHTLTLEQETRPGSAGTGGSVSATGEIGQSGNTYSYVHNTTATLNATANPGFEFIGWLIDDSTTLEPSSPLSMTASHTVKAVFAKQYTLTMAVDPSGAATTSPAVGVTGTYHYDQEVSIGTTPIGSGYSFANWTSSNAGCTFANASSSSTKITITGDTTATAHYTAGSASLKAVINVDGAEMTSVFTALSITADGTMLYSTQTKGYSYNDTATLAATPGNSTYKFIGWSSNVTGGIPATNGTVTIGSGTTTVTAQYKTLHAVTVESETIPSGTGGSAAVTDSNYESISGNIYTYTHGSSATLTATDVSGYRFVRWEIYTGGSVTPTETKTTATVTLTVNADLRAKAVFAQEYLLTFAVNPPAGGSVNMPGSYIAYHGEVISNITATPNTDGYWEFEKWSVPGDALHNSTTNPIPSYTVTADRNFTANFVQTAAGAVTLTVNIELDDEPTDSTTFSVAADGSTLAGHTSPSTLHNGGTKQYFINDTVSLDAASAIPGYDFVGWEDSTVDPHRTFSIAASTTVTARYRTKASLTMAISPSHVGITTPAVGTHTVVSPDPGNLYKGVTVGINSTLDAAYTDTMAFVGWSVNTGANVTDPSMEATSVLLDVESKTATANYTAGYKLEVRVKYETSSTPGGTKTFAVATGDRNTVANGAGNRAGIYLSDPNSLDFSVRTIAQDTNANILAIPSAPGYTFVGWTLNPASDTPDVGLTASTMSVTMNAPKVYTAIFEKTRVKLEVYTIPAGVTGVRGETLGGSLASGPEPRVYEYFRGEVPTLKATSDNPSYGFVAWFKGVGYSTDAANRFSEVAQTTYPEALTAPVTQVTAYFLPYGLHRLVLFADPESNVDIRHVKVPGAVSQTYTIFEGHPACVADVGIDDPFSYIDLHADSAATGMSGDHQSADGDTYYFVCWKPGHGEDNEVITWVRNAYQGGTEIRYPIYREEVRLTAQYATEPAYRLQLEWKFTDSATAAVDPKYEENFMKTSFFDDYLGSIKGNSLFFGYPLLQVNREVQIQDGIFIPGHVEHFDTDAAFADGPFVIDHWTDRQQGVIVNSTERGAGVMTFSSKPGIAGDTQTVTAHIDLIWHKISLAQPVFQRPLGWSDTTITGNGMFNFLGYDDTHFPSDIFMARQVPAAEKDPLMVMEWQRVKGGSAPVLIAAGTPANYRFAGWDINDDGLTDFSASNFNWDTWPAAWEKKVTADRTVGPVYIRQLALTLAMQAPNPTTTLDRAYFDAPLPTGGIEVNKSYMTGSKSYDYGSSYTVTAVPQANHVLLKWIVEKASADGGTVFDAPEEIPAEGSNTLVVTLDYPTKVTAVFAMQQYSFTVDVAKDALNATHGNIKVTHSGTTSGPTTSVTRDIPYGDSPAIEAIPDSGYVFMGWKVSPAGRSLPANPDAASTTVQVDGTKTVTAHFERAVTLTMAVSPGSLPATIISPTVGIHTHYAGKPLVIGSQVPITSGTDGGYDFVEWQIVENSVPRTVSTPNTTLTLIGDTTATAIYAQLFEVEIEASPGTASVPGSINNIVKAATPPVKGGPMTANSSSNTTATGEYREGANVTFTATPSAHYTFDYWEITVNGTAEPAPYPTTPSISRTITGPTKAKAIFTPKNYTIEVKPYASGTLTPIASALDGVTTAAVSPATHNFLSPGSETWTLPYGSSVTLSTTAASHYIFEKWTNATGLTQHGTDPDNYTFTVLGDQVIHAQFKRSEYFLTTVLDPTTTAGSISSSPIRLGNPSTHSADSMVTLTATGPSSVDFDGWSGDIGSGNSANSLLSLTMNQDRTVTARFVDVVRLAVDVSDPAFGGVTVSGERRTEVVGGITYYVFEVGATATITADPTNSAHYQFDNWAFSPSLPTGLTAADLSNSSLSFNMPLTAGSTLDVTANFSARAYTLTVEARAKDSEPVPYPGAGFVQTLDGSGAFTGSPQNFLVLSTASVKYNTTVNLSTSEKPYYRFVRWTNGTLSPTYGTTTPHTYTMPGGDQTVVALFERSHFKLTAHVNPTGGGGIIATPAGMLDPLSTPDTTIYAVSTPTTVVTLTATDASGKIFTGWTGPDTSGATINGRNISLEMDTDREVTANFANAYSVTVPATANGTVIVTGQSPYANVIDNLDGSKTYIFAEGAVATITATPVSQHYYLDSWDFSPDISSTVSPNPAASPIPATISFAVTQDVTVAPKFEAKIYTLRVTPSPAAGAASLVARELASLDHDFLAVDTISRKYPTVVTLEATAKDEPAARYRFDSWKEGSSILGNTPSYSFTFNRDASITANFVRQVQITINAPEDVTPPNSAPPVSVCGTASPGAGTYRYDVTPLPQTVTITATAAEGFEFAGWAGNIASPTSENVTTTATTSTATLTYTITETLAGAADIVLTPTFKRRLYTVNFGFWEKGQELPITCGYHSTAPTANAGSNQYYYGTVFTARISQVYSTYRFLGWGAGEDIIASRVVQQGASGSMPDTYTYAVTADKYISAIFTKVCTLDLSTDPADGSQGTASITSPAGRPVDGQPGKAEFDYGTRVHLEATPVSGAVFLGWAGSVNDQSTPATYIDLKSDRSVVARFKILINRDLKVNVMPSNSGNVTIDGSSTNAVGAGTSNPSTITVQVPDGVTAQLVATPAPGYTFSGWSPASAVTITNPLFPSAGVLMDDNKEVTANFTSCNYTLTVRAMPQAGGTAVSLNGTSFAYNAAANISASANPGYEFKGWDTNGDGIIDVTTSAATIAMTTDKIASAIFVPVGQTGVTTLTIFENVDGTWVETASGVSSHNISSPNVDGDVTITCVLASGYHVAGSIWGGPDIMDAGSRTSDPDTGTYAIEVPTDRNMSIYFYVSRARVTLDWIALPSDGGTVELSPAGGYYYAGTVVRVIAKPSGNHEFSHWAGDLSGTSADTTITVSQNSSIEAYFLPANQCIVTLSFDASTRCLPDDKITLAGSDLRWSDASEIRQFIKYQSHVPLSYTLTDSTNYAFMGWRNAPANAVELMVRPQYDLYVESDMDIRALIKASNPMLETEIRLRDSNQEIDPKPNVVSRGGSISLGDVVTLGKTYTIRVVLEDGYEIDGWEIISELSTLGSTVVTGTDPESGKSYVEIKVTILSLETKVVAILKKGNDPADAVRRRNIVDGGTDMLDDVPANKSSGHYIDGQRAQVRRP